MSWRSCPDPNTQGGVSANAVERLIVPRAVNIGEMEVRRALPSRHQQMVGPFIFFDQMGPVDFPPGQGIDVRPHPHINLSTLTYLFEGEIFHRDSLGSEQIIRPGAVNWMRAGSGIVHSERTPSDRKEQGQRLFGIQTWMALPSEAEEDAPEFIHIAADELPTLSEEGLQIRLIAGNAFGLTSPLRTASETLYADIELAAGQTVRLDAEADEQALYTIDGRIQIDSDSFEPGQLPILRAGRSAVVTANSRARFLYFGGATMDGPRYLWWNFVSSRPERIEQAQADWQAGRFETVPGDADEFIPLPDGPWKVRKINEGTNS